MNRRAMIALVAIALLSSACSGDDEPAPTTTSPPPPATTTPPPPPTTASPPTTEAAAVLLSPCEEFFLAMDVLTAEFIQLVDDGNRSLLLTIGLETPYAQGAEELGAIASRLREVSAELQALGDAPGELAPRLGLVIEAVDQFAVGYQAGSDAAAAEDTIALNRSLVTVSQGTGLLQTAAETPAVCL